VQPTQLSVGCTISKGYTVSTVASDVRVPAAVVRVGNVAAAPVVPVGNVAPPAVV
jgi:hypothetical protein